ncbi:histidine kinase dimerization/phosphoacceptor domain -containing protein [Roseomonas sp. CAU 1739]|uniref:sensor histidine kinase n=1 Tax=Roseomonas sp. CAU 1739 TaxID=3140364 RepID=UPI00325BFCBD
MNTEDSKPLPLSEALDGRLGSDGYSDRFRHFLDHVPFAIAVAELQPEECVTYVNREFERLTGQALDELVGRPWSGVRGIAAAADNNLLLSEAVQAREDHIGRFRIRSEEARGEVTVDAWSNVIQDDRGSALFRLVALAPVSTSGETEVELYKKRYEERDVLLRELQHRVKNNLQLITSLIRMESHHAQYDDSSESLDRLAGRVGALDLLYRTLSEEGPGASVDLGVYLSQIASAVMTAHAVEGIRLDLKVDTWPVSINVAMPAGLVVNEVLTNALKHAFVGRTGGTIKLHSLVDAEGCQVSISDDGVGLPDGTTWPTSGRLGGLIVQSLRQNAGATLNVTSSPQSGLCVTIRFARANAEPEAA